MWAVKQTSTKYDNDYGFHRFSETINITYPMRVEIYISEFLFLLKLSVKTDNIYLILKEKIRKIEKV